MMGAYAQPPSAIQASIRPDEGIVVEMMNVWMTFWALLMAIGPRTTGKVIDIHPGGR